MIAEKQQRHRLGGAAQTVEKVQLKLGFFDSLYIFAPFFMGVLGGLPHNKRVWLAKCYACQDSTPAAVLPVQPPEK